MNQQKIILLWCLLVPILFFSCEKSALKDDAQPLVSTNPTNTTLAVATGGTIAVNIWDQKQTVDLIGAGSYFYSGHLMHGTTNLNDAANWLWQDLTVNVFRIVLRADQVEDLNDNTNPDVTDFTKFNFTANSNIPDQMAAVLKAKQVNPNIKVWAIVLSPPKYLKTNGSVNNGGTLKTSVSRAYDEFGEFIYAHLKHLKDNGITVQYLSLMNEPDYPGSSIPYESAEYTTTQAQSVLTNTCNWLETKLPAVSITVPVFTGPDCISVPSINTYASALNATGNIGLFTTHQYSNSSAANFASAAAATGGKPLYMTEWHAGFGMGTNPNELVASLDLVNKFHDAFRGGAKGWLYFEWSNPQPNFGALILTPWWAPAERKKNYYVFQQYTKGIINKKYITTTLAGITNFGADNVSAFTYSNTADIHVVNWNTDAQNGVRLNFGGNIKTIRIYRTSATENNALIWSQDNVNLNYYNVNYSGKSFTTVRITW